MTTEPDHEIYPEDQAWLQAQIRELTFGRRLGAYRTSREWSQVEAARRLGISRQLYNVYERGHKLPTPSLAYQIGEKLGMGGEALVLAVINDQLRRDNLPIQVAKAV